ncbi:DUF5333 domain-containing protein [Yoonia sp.]|jgi:hypothetical protein|uniref:DUF5333 domain-containing protein n=1 Tax=Yoonia sp. TaxID=2212373 RepID=UPI0025D1AC16|nr:DUF5333 domain-containing protein [Yoonia sp.]
MTKTRALVAALSLAGIALAGSLSAQTALKDVPYVRDGLIDVGMAIEISDKCSSIRARTFRGIGFLQSLKNHASALGYSDAEIEAYVDDGAEKRRLEAIAREKLAALGAVANDESSYCAVGRAQIAQGTQVGRLLR